jgi:hypothetical protein
VVCELACFDVVRSPPNEVPIFRRSETDAHLK